MTEVFTYCFDIDGTLLTSVPDGNYDEAMPIAGRIEHLQALKEQGHQIKLLTARGSQSGKDWRDLTESQIRKWSIPCDELIFGKPHADFYIDDKAVHSDNFHWPPRPSKQSHLSAKWEFFSTTLTEVQEVQVRSDLKHRQFPRPFERLSPLREKNHLVGAEIGVNAGHHAQSLLQFLDVYRLYLIDPYELYEEYPEGVLQYGANQPQLTGAETHARSILHGHSEKIVWLKDFSAFVAKNFEEESLDFVYIDGNHDYKYVREDIENFWPLTKQGGVLGGHDFYNGHAKSHDGVLQAAIEFAVTNGLQLQVEEPDWWFVK